MTFKADWLTGETGHTAVHNSIGAMLNRVSDPLVPTGGDDSAMVQAAVNAYSVINFGPGVFRCSAVTIPSNRKLYGAGYATQIYNAVATDDDPLILIAWGLPEVFQMADGTERVIIQDMAFTGRHVSGWNNGQMASIGLRGITCADILIKDCLFENLVGFSIHQEGFGYNTVVKDCTFRNCGNGLNVNGASTAIHGNYFYQCEGIECSGPASIISDNRLESCYAVGVSIGGSDFQGRGSIVRGNVIRNTTLGSCIGIALGDGLQDCLIESNIITGPGVAFAPAIVASIGSFHGMKGIIIQGNHISAYSSGVYIAGGITPGLLIEDVSILSNRIGYEDNTDVSFPIQIDVPNVYVTGNFLRGINADVWLGSNATNTRLWRNDLRSDHITINAGATIATEP